MGMLYHDELRSLSFHQHRQSCSNHIQSSQKQSLQIKVAMASKTNISKACAVS
jgi:hypothetical protein